MATNDGLDRYRSADGSLLPEWQWRGIDESIAVNRGSGFASAADLVKGVHVDEDGVAGGQVYVRSVDGAISGYGGPGGGDTGKLFGAFDRNTNNAYNRQWGDYSSGDGRSGYGGSAAAVGGTGGPGGGPGGAAGGGPNKALTEGQRDSYVRLNAVLGDYGLASLGNMVQQWLVQGLSEDEIAQRMRDTSEFKTRFPAIEARKKAGLSAISPGEYVAYERNARQLMRAAGLPQGFYDGDEDFTRLLTNDLSLSELGDRVALAANASFRMPKEDRDALTRFGMSPGDITAYWLDPDVAQPVLERKYAAAQLAGASSRATYATLDETTATGLATLGVTAAEGEAGFTSLANQRELFSAMDSGEDNIDQGTQLDAQFRGDSNARRRVEQRARRRSATFEGGGGFASSQGGLVGLGDAD